MSPGKCSGDSHSDATVAQSGDFRVIRPVLPREDSLPIIRRDAAAGIAHADFYGVDRIRRAGQLQPTGSGGNANCRSCGGDRASVHYEFGEDMFEAGAIGPDRRQLIAKRQFDHLTFLRNIRRRLPQ